MANWHDRPATAALYLAICLLTIALRLTSALPTVAGSPCESVCVNAGDPVEDVVCLDADYQNLENGRAFQKCVSCQLNSTAVDTERNETDVGFGLLALRYTLAGCMFAIPIPHISISSPCQVSCATLNSSIGYEITNDTSVLSPSNNDFCNAGRFSNNVINTCAFCYSFIPQQLFLANFLQALHINCVQPHIAGRPFFPDANALFNETLIAGPAPVTSGSSSGGGLHGYQLALAIALPIVGGILIIGSTCWCCFIFTRKRRQKMAATGRMSKVHDANADQMYTPVSPSMKNVEAWGHGEPPREMHAISPTLLHVKHPSPGIAQGRWSHNTGGSEQGTPLRNSFQQEDIGPGSNQVRDPNLHDLYFGVDEEPREVSGPSTTNGQYYDQQARMHHLGDETRGHFV